MANYYFILKVGVSGEETRYDMPVKDSVRYQFTETGGVEGVTPYQLYDYIYSKDICVDIKHTDCGETLYIKLYRDDDTLIYEDSFTIPKHIYRYCKLFTDTIDDNDYTVMSSFSLFLDIEQAPLHYYINKVDIDKEFSEKHIDLLVTDGDLSIVRNNHGYDVIGNTVLCVGNIELDKDGYFIDSYGNKKTFYLNCTYDENGELEEGSWNDYENNQEPFNEDQKYYLYIYDRDNDELVIINHYTPKTTPIGLNPIWDKIYFPGQLCELHTTRNINTVRDVLDEGTIFYFPLFGTTKGKFKEGGLIYPEGDNVTDLRFSRIKDVDCIKLNPGDYVQLPNQYYHDGYSDHGFSCNVWPGDIFDTKPYIENKEPYPNGYIRSLVFKVLLQNDTVTGILHVVSNDVNVINVSYADNKFVIYFGDSNIIISNTIDINEWYTIQLDFVLTGQRIRLSKAIVTKDGESRFATEINELLPDSIINTTLDHTTFTEHSNTDYIRFVSNVENTVCVTRCLLIGYRPTQIEYFQDIIDKKITNHRDLDPKIVFNYDNNVTVEVSYKNFIETTDYKVMFYLPENTPSENNLPIGKAIMDLMIGDQSYAHKNVEIQSIIPDDDCIDFEIDFENDFENAVEKFKDIFYARQEHRGGDTNFGGGENANNIYFCRDGYAVFENHGDYYKGNIPANKKDSGNNKWYGGAEDLISYQLDENNEPISYDEQSKPNPYKRVTRVGSLVQSKRYYGYGAFEIDMKIPKDFRGSAICWWMFHYQEHYPNIDNRYFNYYVGGIDENKATGDDKPANMFNVSDYTGTYNYNGSWNYLHCFKTDSGKPYIIVNNEIDMELGSEGCNTFCSNNPNSAESPYLYFPALDERTAITCTSNDNDRGMWIADLSTPKSQSSIQSHWQNIQNSINEKGYVNTRTCGAFGIKPSELTWIHVSDIVDSGSDNSTHTTRALRWNNWWTEPDISTNTIELKNEQYTNAVKQLNGDTDIKDGVSGFGLNNTVGALTIRTPLGKINLQALDMNDRYIPHYMDDDQWHTWRFEWTDKITRCYIDGELIKTNTANIPFIPMPFLIGVWFPSYKAYDSNYVSDPTSFGGWGGEHAPWDVRHLQVRRIKYTHYTEEEAPRDRMLYHAESYPYSGLREILTDDYEIPTEEYITITLNNVPEGSEITCDSNIAKIDGNTIVSKKNDTTQITIKCDQYDPWYYYTIFEEDASITVEMEYTFSEEGIISFTNIGPINSIIIPAEGYKEDKIINSYESENGSNWILSVKKNTELGSLYAFVQDYDNPITVSLPTITENKNTMSVTLNTGEAKPDLANKVTINISVEDDDTIIPTLELDWGDGYKTIPKGFNKFYMNYGTSWNYRVSSDGYITQENTFTPSSHGASGNNTFDISVTLQKVVEKTTSTVTVTMIPDTANCVIDTDDIENFTALSFQGNNVVELPKDNTYSFTVSQSPYDPKTIFKYITEDFETVQISLDASVLDINLREDDWNNSYNKAQSILENNQDDDVVTWLFMTDTHDNYDSNDSNHIETTSDRQTINDDLFAAAVDFDCSCILHGGDSVGYDSSNDAIDNIEEVLSSNVNIGELDIPVLYTTGNHDSQGRGVAFDTQIDPIVVYNKCVAPFVDKLTYTDTEYYSTNSYYDDVDNKIRFISIDTYFDKNHQKWEGTNLNRTKQLAQAAINSTPSDYKIIIISHEIIGPNWYGSNSGNQLKTLGNTNKTYFSYDKYSDLYDTLKANCPNFSNVVMFLHGHHHNSNQSASNDNKLFISTEPAAIDVKDVYNNRNKNYDNYSAISRSSNTNYASCYACDLFIYNKTKQVLDVIRFGKGGDRHINLNKQIGDSYKITMAQGYFSATLTSNTVTDFSNYYILISTNKELNTGYLDNYKFSTVIKSTSSGSVSTYTADGTTGTVISIPINCDYTVQLCTYENYKYIGKKMLGTYNWNEDNYYSVVLGDVNVD